MPSDETNIFTQLIESRPAEAEREQARAAFLAGFDEKLRREDIARERAKDPMRFALARLDLSEAPHGLSIDQGVFSRGAIILTWWPNGTRDHLVRDYPPPSDEFLKAWPIGMAAKERLVKAECRRINHEFAPSFLKDEELTVKALADLVERHVGFRPRVVSEDAAYEKLTGAQPGPTPRPSDSIARAARDVGARFVALTERLVAAFAMTHDRVARIRGSDLLCCWVGEEGGTEVTEAVRALAAPLAAKYHAECTIPPERCMVRQVGDGMSIVVKYVERPE